jgi:phosphoribosylanthranilate isomerase
MRVKPDTQPADLLEYEHAYRAASPADVPGPAARRSCGAYGGAGKVFDWSLIPKELAPRVVLSGGLSVQNATEAVVSRSPLRGRHQQWCRGGKGIKDARKIRAFIAAVRARSKFKFEFLYHPYA